MIAEMVLYVTHSWLSYSLLTNLSLLSLLKKKKDIHVLWVNGIDGIEINSVPPQHPSSILLSFL